MEGGRQTEWLESRNIPSIWEYLLLEPSCLPKCIAIENLMKIFTCMMIKMMDKDPSKDEGTIRKNVYYMSCEKDGWISW